MGNGMRGFGKCQFLLVMVGYSRAIYDSVSFKPLMCSFSSINDLISQIQPSRLFS